MHYQNNLKWFSLVTSTEKLHVQNYPSNLKFLQKAVVIFQPQFLNSEFLEWCISLLKVSTGDVFLGLDPVHQL